MRLCTQDEWMGARTKRRSLAQYSCDTDVSHLIYEVFSMKIVASHTIPYNTPNGYSNSIYIFFLSLSSLSSFSILFPSSSSLSSPLFSSPSLSPSSTPPSPPLSLSPSLSSSSSLSSLLLTLPFFFLSSSLFFFFFLLSPLSPHPSPLLSPLALPSFSLPLSLLSLYSLLSLTTR